MEEGQRRDVETLFAHGEDPRVERTKLHRLRDIIILAMCGVLCGAEGWVESEEFAKAKEAFVTQRLDLPNGIPSHETFGRVFALMDPKQFEAGFVQWVQGISQTVKGVIAIDGKTLRRSPDQAAGKKALQLVSAWAVENRLVLAQLASEEKSKELTAIPLLLQQLALDGCLVTIDAMGTQTKIASQIIEQAGDYALARHARTRGMCMKRSKRRLRWRSRMALWLCNGSRIVMWRKDTGGLRSENTGPSVLPRSSRILIQRRNGRDCEGLGWSEQSDGLARK
jgi:hypothetical protein